MDPNNNPPTGPQNPESNPGAQQAPAPPSPAAPDWQQGLGGAAPQQPTPGGTVGGPAQPPAAMPGGMPANQPPLPPTPPDSTVPGAGPSLPPMGTGMNSMPGKKKIPPVFILAGVVLVVLLIVVATYFMFFKKSGTATDAAKKSSSAAKATSMATLSHVTLNVPDTITGYKSRNTGVATVKDYLSDDGTCEFIVGTVTASQLPGADLNAIVNPQLKQLRDGGATVKGPNAGAALDLKEQGGSKSYSMPTLNFEFSQDKKHAVVHYSAVILSSTDRAVVNRTCVNKDGAVDTARINALDTLSKSVTVTVKQ